MSGGRKRGREAAGAGRTERGANADRTALEGEEPA